MDERVLHSDHGGHGGYAPAGSSHVVERAEVPLLLLRGSIEGAALEDLGSLLDDALHHPASRVDLGLAGVTGWSLLAQAMVLHTARRMSSQDRHLVLRSPSPALRRQSRTLGLFDRVTTAPDDA